MLHSGSRGVGNRIGMFFIEMARNDMRQHIKNLPDRDLAYFEEGSEHFEDYVDAVSWAQEFAMYNRKLMMEQLIDAVSESGEVPQFALTETAVNCHHNYVAPEEHYGHQVFVTRKGAVRAGKGDMGIIPGSMGARSYIVRGLGNDESFHSCSHGAGRAMSRNEAKRRFSYRRSPQGHRRRRVPQGRGRDRRDTDGVQADRRRDERAERFSRDRPHTQTGHLCKGIKDSGNG